jgi:proline dehydrogenase
MQSNLLPNLNNTKIAFSRFSNVELRASYWLFRLMGIPWMVDWGSRLAQWSIRIGLPVQWAIRKTVYQQFCGGETIDGCDAAVAQLAQGGVGTILDYSVEGAEDDAAFDACAEEIIKTIQKARGDERIPFAVFKISGVAPVGLLERVGALPAAHKNELPEWDLVRLRVRRIVQAAADADQAILVDAEESWIQDAIDSLVHDLVLEFNRVKPLVYQTVQLYRHDRLAYLKSTYAQMRMAGCYFAVKLVRGAYMEKERERAATRNYPSPIQPSKAATDRDFDEAVFFCLDHIEHMALCCGSHNEESNLKMINKMHALDIAPGDTRVWSAQLKGMSDHISFNLADAGYRVAKYLPYGPVSAVLPYLVRRARENTSIAGQMSRELALLAAERQRRKSGR